MPTLLRTVARRLKAETRAALVGLLTFGLAWSPALADNNSNAGAAGASGAWHGGDQVLDTWMPPSWHPAPDELEVLPDMDGHADKKASLYLGARAAFVYDLDSGKVLVERAADDRRPIASLTKLVSSLAMASEQPDLEQVRCVGMEFLPSRSGARSKLPTGTCWKGWDLLGAALVASDNRAAYGLQVVSGLGFDDFVSRMNDVAQDLHMSRSSFADPSGLEDDNLSTARDVARAAVAVAAHPVLSIAATARQWTIAPTDSAHRRVLGTTDHAASRNDLEILAAKTGYTDTAGYCFATVLRTAHGRTVAIALLGEPRSVDRWADVDRVIRWVDGESADHVNATQAHPAKIRKQVRKSHHRKHR